MTIDHEDRELFAMVRENRRRSGITTQTGIIVPLEDAKRFAVWEARGRRSSGTWRDAAYFTVAALGILAGVLGVIV